MDKEVTYTLETPLKYAYRGEPMDGEFITLKAPTSRNMAECAALKQAFFRALPQDGAVEADTTDTGDAEITGEGVMTLITMSKDVELASVLVTGRELLTSGVALIEGEEKLTKPLLDNISQDDLEGMLGEYLANFILASALQRLKKMQ